MASIRIGIASEFNLVDSKVGVGTTNPTELMDVRGQIYSDNSIGAGGISTVTTYQGFLDTKQTIKSSVSEGTVVAGSLSEEIVIEGEVTVSTGTTYKSGVENLTVTDNFTLPGISDYKPTVGDIRFNENLGAIQVYIGGPEGSTDVGGTDSPNFPVWRSMNSRVDSGNGGRGVFFGGGWGPAPLTDSTLIDYIQISTLGNAVNFGNLVTATVRSGACSSPIRGLCGGGSFPTEHNVIQYVTIQSTGNSIDFGDLTGENNEKAETSALSSSTRGVWGGGGQYPDSATDIMDYVEIMTLGNALDFGNLTEIKSTPGAVSNGTRGVFMGGAISTYVSNIDYMTISSKGDAKIFGDLTVAAGRPASFSNRVRGFSAGGTATGGYLDVIQIITIASAGNAVDFGNLSNKLRAPGGTSNQIRGIAAGGLDPSVYINTIEYITMASAGNAADFGDLTQQRMAAPGCSDSHGGLGGF